MAVFYNREKSKIGTLTGTIIHFPRKMTEENDPALASNFEKLPAGYLRCDGSVLSSVQYPALAAVLGTGTGSRFRKTAQVLTDTQFQLPDLRQKHIRATSSSNVGRYNDLTVEDVDGNEQIKAGVGLDVIQNIPSPFEISYTGKFFLPSQTVDVRGEPSFTRSSGSYTFFSEISQTMVQPHMHFSSTTRARQADSSGNEFRSPAQNSVFTRSSLDICSWFSNTRQDLCYVAATAIVAPNQKQSFDLGAAGSYESWGLCWSGCSTYMTQGYCLWPQGCAGSTTAFGFRSGSNDCNFGGGGPDNTTIGNITYTGTWGQRCEPSLLNFGSINGENQPPPTGLSANYTFPTVPFANIQYNATAREQYSAVSNYTTRVGSFGNAQNHRHRLPFDAETPHTYKVVTQPVDISANDGLVSTINIRINESKKADEFIQPYIITEYLIKT